MILWVMVIAQMLAWLWFSISGGKLDDKNFLIFTAMMLLGQLASCIETYEMSAWRSFAAQGYFLVSTAFGGYRRFRQMRRASIPDPASDTPV